MANKRETKLQQAICRLVEHKYPQAIYNSDSSGIKLTIGQAIQMTKVKKGKGFPDFVLYVRKMGFGALFLELKAEGEKVYKKDGSLYASKVVTQDGRQHLEVQEEKILQLRKAGYFAAFVIGFDDAAKAIDAYLAEDMEMLAAVTLPHFTLPNAGQ